MKIILNVIMIIYLVLSFDFTFVILIVFFSKLINKNNKNQFLKNLFDFANLLGINAAIVFFIYENLNNIDFNTYYFYLNIFLKFNCALCYAIIIYKLLHYILRLIILYLYAKKTIKEPTILKIVIKIKKYGNASISDVLFSSSSMYFSFSVKLYVLILIFVLFLILYFWLSNSPIFLAPF